MSRASRSFQRGSGSLRTSKCTAWRNRGEKGKRRAALSSPLPRQVADEPKGLAVTLASDDRYFMERALAEAKLGASKGEVPVGAVIALAGKLVAKAHNRPIALSDPTAHAEVLALRKAGRKLEGYRFEGATLYVTVEPCVMCVGAILNARVGRLVFGAWDEKAGAVGSVYDLARDRRLGRFVEVRGGLMEAECAAVMREFFRARRSNR
jgi:tRNA(adenine34) deaminase